jgi:hypothetical protein
VYQDFAGNETRSKIWQFNDLPSTVDPTYKHYNKTANLRMQEYFTQNYSKMETEGKTPLLVRKSFHKLLLIVTDALISC